MFHNIEYRDVQWDCRIKVPWSSYIMMCLFCIHMVHTKSHRIKKIQTDPRTRLNIFREKRRNIRKPQLVYHPVLICLDIPRCMLVNTHFPNHWIKALGPIHSHCNGTHSPSPFATRSAHSIINHPILNDPQMAGGMVYLSATDFYRAVYQCHFIRKNIENISCYIGYIDI